MTDSRTLIILKSVHRMNTERVAHAIANVLQADIVDPQQADPGILNKYDLVGFGSGIYFGRFHSQLRAWVKRLEPLPERKPAFLFSTAGLSFLQPVWHWSLARQLSCRGLDVIGQFSCRGHDLVGPLWLVGGLNRGHPSETDLTRAADFARQLLENGPAKNSLQRPTASRSESSSV